MSFDYRIACASSVSQVCETNRSNFFADGKSMKKGNRGTTAPLIINGNSDSEQIVGLFEGISSSETSHIAIGCLRYFIERKAKEDTEYLKHLERLMTATDKVVSSVEAIADKRTSCMVGFLRYNGFYFAGTGDTLVFLLRSGEIKLLNSASSDVRPVGGEGFLACDPICGELQSGDRIVICTNSLKKSIPRDKFSAIILNTKPAEECADKLCEAVTERGIADCASCLVIDVLKKTSEGYWILPSFVEETPPAAAAVDPMLEAPTVEVLPSAAFSKSEKSEPAESENPPNKARSEGSYYTPAQKAAMNRPAQAKKNNKKLAVIIVALVAILAVIIVSVVVALTSIGKAKDDTSSSDSDFTAGSDGQTDPEPENDDTDDDTAEDDTTDNSSNDSSDDSSDDTSDDTSDEPTDDSSDTETEDSSEEPSSEPENEPEEPVGNESGVTSRGYTVSNKNGAYYVTLGSTEILVANKTYELDENYNPGGLTSDTKSAFNELVSAAGDAGHTITNVSGFRSYATQERVYNGWVNTYGTEGADRISARPGHSEHQTGMAIDVNSLDESFGDTDTGKWLASNAHKYGFIIRYPKGKEHITGYSYEPWHIRYVGEIAADIYESGLTLEEYLGITSSY